VKTPARRAWPLAALAGLVAALGLGCGPPRAGEGCKGTGFACADATAALECRSGTWTELPCRGPGGCAEVGSQVSCDQSADVAGDACAEPLESEGLCGPGGTSVLQCHAGTLVTTASCQSCAVVAGLVTCTP
jgi:hypothetical protein